MMKLFAPSPHLKALWLLTFFLFSPCAPARAQDLDDVSIGGLVTDQHGAALPGASVTARHEETGAERAAVTDGEGRYRLVDLAPGAYAVRASAGGFAAEEKRGPAAVAGQAVRLDFTLRPAGPAAEQVTVVAAADSPAVDASRVVVGGTLTRAEIERLPVATRSPLDLVFTLGGVAEEPLSVRDTAADRAPSGGSARAATTPEEAGVFSLAGGPAYTNNITVDGLDSNDDRAARERFQPPPEAVEEVQVITSQFSAEYGRASGGRVNLRTRGGTRNLRARLSYFFADESLNANTWNNNRRGLGRLPFQQHTPGLTLGGPLRFSRAKGDGPRPKTFFFAAYEYDTVLDSTLIDAPCVPA